jgi:ATP-dependent DNA ligase
VLGLDSPTISQSVRRAIKKGLRHAAIVSSYRHYVAAYSPAGFIAPCLPTKTDKLPSGSQWLHEIKHDGFSIIARKTGAQVRLYSRPGNDLTHRFPLIVETLARLRSRSCIIDGEGRFSKVAPRKWRRQR